MITLQDRRESGKSPKLFFALSYCLKAELFVVLQNTKNS